MKKVLIITSSLREQSNSTLLAEAFKGCVENVNLKGIVYDLNLNDQGEARYSESLKQAYEMGKNI